MLLLLALLLGCTLFVWLFFAHYYEPYYIRKTLGISGPQPLPFYGNYKEIADLGYLESRRRWASKYGTTFLCFIGIKPTVVTQDVDIIKAVMVKNFERFINRQETPALLQTTKNKAIQGLVFLRDEKWRRMRRILTPIFSSKKLRMMAPLIQKSCERLNEKMSSVSNSGKSVDMWKWFGQITMEVILATAFSRDVDTQRSSDDSLTKAAASIFQNIASGNSKLDRLRMIVSHIPWICWVLKYIARRSPVSQSVYYFENIALNLVEDRKKCASRGGSVAQDLLQLLLEAYDEDEVKGETHQKGCLSSDEIVNIIITFTLAGYETTSNALSYTVYLLALNPPIQDKLTREIENYYDANPDASLYDAAENINYVTMVLSESLRLFPPAPRTIRDCNQTCAVSSSLVIPEGVDISFPIFLLHRNPNYWSNPDKFDPERFRPGEQTHPPFAYLPFGEGPRNCIGKRLALLEAKMILVSIYNNFQFSKTAETEDPLSLKVGITMSPKNGIKLSIVSK